MRGRPPWWNSLIFLFVPWYNSGERHPDSRDKPRDVSTFSGHYLLTQLSLNTMGITRLRPWGANSLPLANSQIARLQTKSRVARVEQIARRPPERTDSIKKQLQNPLSWRPKIRPTGNRVQDPPSPFQNPGASNSVSQARDHGWAKRATHSAAEGAQKGAFLIVACWLATVAMHGISPICLRHALLVRSWDFYQKMMVWGLRLVEQGRPHGYELITDQPQNTAAVAQFLKISMRQLVWLRVWGWHILGCTTKPHDIKCNGLHETVTYQRSTLGWRRLKI